MISCRRERGLTEEKGKLETKARSSRKDSSLLCEILLRDVEQVATTIKDHLKRTFQHAPDLRKDNRTARTKAVWTWAD
jgi:hypothetical protein